MMECLSVILDTLSRCIEGTIGHVQLELTQYGATSGRGMNFTGCHGSTVSACRSFSSKFSFQLLYVTLFVVSP